jgi:hydrogenase expression/formation protein HypC
MCLAIPGKITEITSDTHAKVDFGGVLRQVNIELVKPKVGEYVVVHAGFAIEIMTAKDAEENLKLLGIS